MFHDDFFDEFPEEPDGEITGVEDVPGIAELFEPLRASLAAAHTAEELMAIIGPVASDVVRMHHLFPRPGVFDLDEVPIVMTLCSAIAHVIPPRFNLAPKIDATKEGDVHLYLVDKGMKAIPGSH